MTEKTKKKEIDLLDIWRLAVKRKWIIISLAVVFAVVAAVRSYTRTPMYQAQASILIEEPSDAMMDINQILNTSTYYRSNYLGTYFNTQLKLLTSRSLAERVARRMDLANRPELQMPRKSGGGVSGLLKKILSFNWLKPKRDKDEEMPEDEFSLEALPNMNNHYAFMVLGGLSVFPVEDTRIVNLVYTSSHPVLAADTVNTIAEEFINYTIEMRYEATRQAAEFLSAQIAETRNELAAKEREIQRYGEEKKILFLKERENTVVNKFAEYSNAFNQAQIDRFNKEATYRELRNLDVDSVPPVVDNTVIQNLQAQYSQAKVDYEEKSRIFKPDYPEMKRLATRIDSLKTELQSEIEKAVETARRDYQEALQKEETLRKELESQRQEVVKTNNDAILYNSLSIEVETKRNLLNSMLARQNETLVSARLRGLRTSNIKIIDRALVPGGPLPRNAMRNIILALFLGLLLGGGLAFFIEYMDNTVKDPEEMKHLVGLPSLGVVPFLSPNGAKNGSRYNSRYYSSSYGGNEAQAKDVLAELKDIELINHKHPNLSIAEDYRTIRTSILFSQPDSPPKVIVFTSPFPQEGKTATVSNLAISFAQLGRKVLIIDADLRRPRLHKVFKLQNVKGMSSYLTGKVKYDEIVQETSVKNLYVISSGPTPPNPAELLDSEKMKGLLKSTNELFDIVLIDSPPILAVIDPVILSSMADSMVLVVRYGKTTKKALVKAIEEAEKSSVDIIGLIFNEVKLNRTAGYYTPSYHRYMDQYYEEK